MDASMNTAVRYAAAQWTAGEFRPGVPINRALTAGEIAQMVQTGALLPVYRLGGSMVPIAITNSTFDSSLTGWSTVVAGGNTIVWDATSGVGGSGAALFTNVGGANCKLHQDINLTALRGRVVRIRFYANPTSATSVRFGEEGGTFAISPAVTVTSASYYTVDWLIPDGITSNRFNVFTTSPQIVAVDDISITPVGALLQPEITRTAQVLDHGPNRIRGVMTAGIRPLSDRDPQPFEFVLTTTGAFLTGASTNPLFFETGFITDVFATASVAGADIILRRNSSSTNDIVTASTDLPTTNPTRLTLIDAQRNFAAGETLWGSASTGTITIRGFWTRR
jgi:hypothetical protein